MNRRTFVQTTCSISALGVGITGDVIGEGAEEIMAEEVGLKDEISELLLKGEMKRAKDTTNQHDIRHILKSEVVGIKEGNASRLGELDIKKEAYETGHGVGVAVEMPDALDTAGNQTSSVQTDLTRVDSGNDDIPVTFEYSHTRALSSNLGTVSISIGPAGLSVDTSRADTVWRKTITAKPGEYKGPE